MGEALIKRDNLQADTWDHDADEVGGLSSRALRDVEHPIEILVSKRIGAMPFVWLDVDDPPGPESVRGLIERNAIALLSNVERPAQDPPSPEWLGRNSARALVRASGLWNNNHVQERYDSEFLDALAKASSLAKDQV